MDYPRIAEALCSGRLSYSKVRAITRVVTPETETTLLGLALGVPTSQIERIVAGRRRVDVLNAATAGGPRHLSVYYDEDGSGVGVFRLDPDETAALLAALTLGKEILRDQKGSARYAEAARRVPTGESVDGCEPDYPDVIYIDDEDHEDFEYTGGRLA